MADTGHWTALGLKLNPKAAVGFVYLIIEKATNRIYIGKKNFKGQGIKNKNEESNWKVYCSSSKEVQRLIAEQGKEAFEFFILDQYFTRGGLSFAETWTQVTCMIPCHNDRYFNRFIDKVTFKVTEPVTARHKRLLTKLLKEHPLKG